MISNKGLSIMPLIEHSRAQTQIFTLNTAAVTNTDSPFSGLSWWPASSFSLSSRQAFIPAQRRNIPCVIPPSLHKHISMSFNRADRDCYYSYGCQYKKHTGSRKLSVFNMDHKFLPQWVTEGCYPLSHRWVADQTDDPKMMSLCGQKRRAILNPVQCWSVVWMPS